MDSLGWDGKRLAKEAGVTESTVSRLISLHPSKAHEDCWISTLVRIAEALGFTVEIHRNGLGSPDTIPVTTLGQTAFSQLRFAQLENTVNDLPVGYGG